MQKAHFSVDTRLTRLLGEGYRSSEAALKELVDNAWDADARSVTVLLPSPLSGEPVVIRDDGVGMTPEQVATEYLTIARDRRDRGGEFTGQLRRKVKGRKGIGKFAGLTLARVMEVETIAGGNRSFLTLDKDALRSAPDDLEDVPLPVTASDADDGDHGTTITLRDLDQRLNFPTPERLRELLVQEYGRAEDFHVTVGEIAISVDDVPGATTKLATELPGSGASDLRFTVSDGKRPVKSPGIVLKVNGKVVGKPRFFGLETDEEVPAKLLKRVYGEIELSGAEDFVTPDWGDVTENSVVYQAASEHAREAVKAALQSEYAREMSLQRARLTKTINERLSKLPEHRRLFAEQAVNRLLKRFYGDSPGRIAVVAEVALDAMEHDAYWAVVEQIRKTDSSDIMLLSSLLDEFGLVDLAGIGSQARRRKEFLDALESLADNPEALEQQMHRALENNTWVMGRRFSFMSSNSTLRSLVETRLLKRYEGDAGNLRPDLLLSQDMSDRYLLLEFKRPSYLIKRTDIAQAEQYRDELSHHLPSSALIELALIGKGKMAMVDEKHLAPHTSIQSYKSLISSARVEIDWLIASLSR